MDQSSISLLLTIAEVAQFLRISRSRVYELLSAGVLRSVKIGSSRRIPRAEVEQFVARLLEEETGEGGAA